jgi:predicted RNase H-like nuclease (RuvC/YqgF family)
MTIEVALVIITGASVAFGIYQGVVNIGRDRKANDKSEASQLTTVIVKLENIGTGIARIENEMTNLKKDVREDHDRIIKVEEAIKSVYDRLGIVKEKI